MTVVRVALHSTVLVKALVEVVLGGSDERSGVTNSAEPGCPYSGSWDRFPTPVYDCLLYTSDAADE